MSLSIGILLDDEKIRIGKPWIAAGCGDLCVSLRTRGDRDFVSIQGTPEDMDRLAAAASEAAATARAPLRQAIRAAQEQFGHHLDHCGHPSGCEQCEAYAQDPFAYNASPCAYFAERQRTIEAALLDGNSKAGAEWWANTESRRFRLGRWEFYRDKRDWWIGAFFSERGTYFCFLTLLAKRGR